MTKKITTSNHYTYTALLRGINVGGHKKVPMADLKKAFEKMGIENVHTLRASGNVVFEAADKNTDALAKKITAMLESTFKFSIPVILRRLSEIQNIIDENPFKEIIPAPDLRLYVTFLKEKPKGGLNIPYSAEGESFKIISIKDNAVYTVVDLSKTKTVDMMSFLEKEFGKNITTRTWDTVVKIGKTQKR
jgi:uncharacterized protein (DUF1697 family)